MAINDCTFLPKIVTTCFMTEVTKENLSHSLPFLAIFCLTMKLPQMATTCFMTEVAKNGNYVLHDWSCQKWQFLLTSKLPKMATIYLMAKVAKNGNFYWPQSCHKWQKSDLSSLWSCRSFRLLPFLAIICNHLLPFLTTSVTKQVVGNFGHATHSCHFWQLLS